MSQSKARLLELNARLAQNLRDNGVEAAVDETTTVLIDKVPTVYEEGYTKGYTEGEKEGYSNGYEKCEEEYEGAYTSEQIMALINGTIKEFTIPYGTTLIGHSAFRGRSFLTTVNIPDTVTEIGTQAFALCHKLHLELPDGITTIGTGALSECGNIITRLPTELKIIGNNAFQYCNSYFSISEIPSKVEQIGNIAFQSCVGITELTFKGTPASISSNSFQGCTNLLNIYVPWAESEVANAPWGATNATIHYNSEV